jgi:RHS repeat-associated protein
VRTVVQAYVGGQWTAFSYTERDFIGRLPLGIETSFADGSAKSWRFLRGPDASGSLEGAGGARGVLAVLKDAFSWKAVAADTLGNVLALAGTNGDFTRRTFDPWGNPLIRDAAGSLRAATLTERRADYDALPLAWASQEVDPDTGLTHYHFREYSPSLGGWLTRDPIGLAGGHLNLRSYLGNRPADALDVWGREFWLPKSYDPNTLDFFNWSHLKDEGWDRTRNSYKITLKTGCGCDKVAEILRQMMRNFAGWDSPNKNPVSVRGADPSNNISDKSWYMSKKLPQGTTARDYAVFNAINITDGTITPVIGSFVGGDANMTVKLQRFEEPDLEGTALQATTLDRHPLIGARRWGVKELDKTTLIIWTESYDTASNLAVQLFGVPSHRKEGEDNEAFHKRLEESNQLKVWEVYMKNLAYTPGLDDCIASREHLPPEFTRFRYPHPWRPDLRW